MGIWKQIRDGTDDMALIFEDDAIPLGDFARDLERAVDQAGQFDVLNLGCVMCDFRIRKDPVGVREVSVFAGAHAYVLTKEGARKLLNLYSSVVFHIDMMMSAASMRGVILKATNKTLVSQKGHDTSSNAALTGFPGMSDTIMKQIHFDAGTDASIYANTNHFRLGTWNHHMYVDTIMIVVFLVGVSIGQCGFVPWGAILALLSLDILYMNNPQDDRYAVSMFKTTGSFIIGYALGHLIRA